MNGWRIARFCPAFPPLFRSSFRLRLVSERGERRSENVVMGGFESPRSARPDSALTQLSPRGRNVPPFSPAGKGPVRQYNTVRHDGTISPRRSFMGPCAPIPAVEAPKGAPTARPKKKKGPDPHWMTSNELTHINFVKKGMVKHLPQFDIPELPEGVVPPMTPSMREKMLLEKGPDEVAADLKGRTFHSDIFNAMPPPPGYFETGAFLHPAEPAQQMLPGDDRPRWKN